MVIGIVTVLIVVWVISCLLSVVFGIIGSNMSACNPWCFRLLDTAIILAYIAMVSLILGSCIYLIGVIIIGVII